MIDYSDFYTRLQNTTLKDWADKLPNQVDQILQTSNHGDLPKWFSILENLPKVSPSSVDFSSDYVRIGENQDCSDEERKEIEEAFRKFHPWRKGPFDLFGIPIEAEWRSDMKWNRLKDHLSPLKDRMILDVGCGNGYYLWRMLGEGAKLAVGIDPTLLYVMQFFAFEHFTGSQAASVLPLGIDDLPEKMDVFDTVFSMGILYHRRLAQEHLLQLKNYLREEGELVLETLVIEGKQDDVLIPKERYAQMRNVWAVPSVLALESWLKEASYRNIRVVDITKTTAEEQRVTDWMGFQSLADFLDPKNPDLTVEGYPAPRRAIVLAQR